MTRFFRSHRLLLTALVLAVGVSACDFQAAEDAFDEFQIIIGLDPIESPVSGLVYDRSSGEMLRATLQFGGSGASSLIDAYSDPLGSTMEAEGGAVTFGIANNVTPSSASPFTFTVTAQVEGYYAQTRTVTSTDVGGVDFELAMTRQVDGFSSIAGTSSVQDGSIQTSQTGAVQQTRTVQTQGSASAQATATVTAGSIARASNGQPLTGQLQTQVRAYDPAQGSSSLPQGATMVGNGNQAIVGAVYFLMTDAAGHAAASFSPGKRGQTSAGKAGACEQAGGFLELVVTMNDPTTVAAVQALGSVQAQIWAFTPADGANNQLGSTTLTLNGGAVEGIICAGGAQANVDLNNLGNTAQGAFFTLVLPPNLGTLAPLDLSLTVSNASGASVPGTITFQGPGVYANRSLSFPSASRTRPLSEWLGVSGSYFVASGGTYTITVQADGGSPVSTTVPDPSTGSASLALSAGAQTTNYTVNASFSCPQGTRFDVAVTNESLDAVSVFYRRLPDGQPRVIPN
ncbi:MAG: hypothetical protein O2899_07925, partial [Bacteroidetes bacterium]|nr:hypothetical protein [Bacteroidota bacterium]